LYLRNGVERNARRRRTEPPRRVPTLGPRLDAWALYDCERLGYPLGVRRVRKGGDMGSFKIARADFFDQYFDWSRRLFSDAFVWAMNQIGQSQDISWGAVLHFINDYLALPLVVLIALAVLLKHTLSG
jgi:hypothetical protein